MELRSLPDPMDIMSALAVGCLSCPREATAVELSELCGFNAFLFGRNYTSGSASSEELRGCVPNGTIIFPVLCTAPYSLYSALILTLVK